jgi:hypothetical protein
MVVMEETQPEADHDAIRLVAIPADFSRTRVMNLHERRLFG